MSPLFVWTVVVLYVAVLFLIYSRDLNLYFGEMTRKAVARDALVQIPILIDFLSRHGPGTSATVLQSLKTLMKKELVFRDMDAEGSPCYGVYDVLFGRWIGA
ncbi:MAG: hypothetical protein P1P86_15100 [Bacteroidales bacterium]|nr:hypothetical protein [Bacteroidales bacterium]